MLPNLALITLDEHTADIIGHQVRCIRREVQDGLILDPRVHSIANEETPTRRGKAWVFLLTTEAPSYFFLFFIFFAVLLFLYFCNIFNIFVSPGALALPCLW
jgi:hypothetical protein